MPALMKAQAIQWFSFSRKNANRAAGKEQRIAKCAAGKALRKTNALLAVALELKACAMASSVPQNAQNAKARRKHHATLAAAVGSKLATLATGQERKNNSKTKSEGP
jgi:hypothetical protein